MLRKKSASTTHLLHIIFFLMVGLNSCWSQKSLNQEVFQDKFDLAMSFQHASYTDTALVLFENLLAQLDEAGLGDSELALKAEANMAFILIRYDEDFASDNLLSIIERGTEREYWEPVADAYITLALVHEVIGQQEKCGRELAEAQKLIEKYGLSAIYPRYAIRRSSYFRVFGISQDSSLYYAEEALRTSAVEPNENLAVAYFLVSSLRKNISLEEKLQLLKSSVRTYLIIGDYYGSAAMLRNISNNFYKVNAYDSALHYTQLIYENLQKIEPPYKLDYFFTKSSADQLKSELFHQKGNYDSAWHYIKLYDESREEGFNRLNARAIAEVEAKYYDEKKAQQIKEQEQELKFERSRRNIAFLVAVIILVSALVLFYLNLQVRKANKKITQQAERLSNLDEAKSRFFANISHELRTPLTLILGPIQNLLKSGSLDTDQTKMLKLAHNNGEQLQKLINEILTLRKLEMGKLGLDKSQTEVADFFKVNLSQFESMGINRNIGYEYSILINDEIYANIDREKLRIILYNLLANAFKFSPKDGKVQVEAELKKTNLLLTVRDTGEGIHPDDLPYVFDRYFQTTRAEKPIEGGTGIGLALSQEYAKLMLGSIQVESKLGEGTSFKVSIPLELVENVQENVELEKQNFLLENKEYSQESPPINIFPKSELPIILLVEDNKDLSDYIKIILSDEYQVVQQANGAEAWDYLMDKKKGKAPCDLIISDLMMPIMDGYQFAEKLKAHQLTRNIPLIILSARAEMQDKLKALRIGVDDYIYKPFEEEELKVRIANLLENQQSRLEISEEELKEEVEIPVISDEDQKWLIEVETYVFANLADSRLSVPVLSEHFAMSKSTLLRQLKRLTGLTPSQYIKEMRLEKARRLLESRTYNSISQIAYETGYADPKSFSRAFKRRFGKIPSEIITN